MSGGRAHREAVEELPESPVSPSNRIPERTPVRITVPPWLPDHRFEGRAVLPAILALQTMARALGGSKVEIRDASFLRFLTIPDDAHALEVLVIFEELPDRSIRSALVTKRRVGSMTRSIEHVVATFAVTTDLPELPLDLAAAPEGLGIRVDAADVYAQMVPFRRAFHNLADPIWLTTGGATAAIVCPELTQETTPLGSIFPMDAAFHLACAWGQRYLGATTFPVGFDRRVVLDPITPGEDSWCRLVPSTEILATLDLPSNAASDWSFERFGSRAGATPEELRFDLWLHSADGRLREGCLGVRMADVSRGRLRAPSWLRNGELRPFDRFGAELRGVTLLELDAVTPLSRASLTAREAERLGEFGEKRARSFLGARMALKQLVRVLGRGPWPVRGIETLAADSVRPICGDMGLDAAAAHDDRFVVAAAADCSVGVDVERISQKAVRGAKLFLDEDEGKADVKDPEVATRLWTVKEAAAKALNAPLAEAWSRTRIVATGSSETEVTLDGEAATALHEIIEGHVLTVLTVPRGDSC